MRAGLDYGCTANSKTLVLSIVRVSYAKLRKLGALDFAFEYQPCKKLAHYLVFCFPRSIVGYTSEHSWEILTARLENLETALQDSRNHRNLGVCVFRERTVG